MHSGGTKCRVWKLSSGCNSFVVYTRSFVPHRPGTYCHSYSASHLVLASRVWGAVRQIRTRTRESTTNQRERERGGGEKVRRGGYIRMAAKAGSRQLEFLLNSKYHTA